MGSSSTGPILFAYDGSDEAKNAIRAAGRQLRRGRRALVLTVWEPLHGVPFVGIPGLPPEDAEDSFEEQAQRVAEEGSRLARVEGFEAEPITERGDPIWERIVQVADERKADIVVMGTHGRTGIPLVVMGSVAGSTSAHAGRPVLIAHDDDRPEPERSP